MQTAGQILTSGPSGWQSKFYSLANQHFYGRKKFFPGQKNIFICPCRTRKMVGQKLQDPDDSK
jgi:hypothetical protein